MSMDLTPLEEKGCHQPVIPEEVDTSPPTFTHWPIIDIDNLPKTSPSNACHPSPGPPSFWRDITSPLPPTSLSDKDPLYSSNTSTSHASVQTNSLITEAITLIMDVNPGRARNNSHAQNSSLPVTTVQSKEGYPKCNPTVKTLKGVIPEVTRALKILMTLPKGLIRHPDKQVPAVNQNFQGARQRA